MKPSQTIPLLPIRLGKQKNSSVGKRPTREVKILPVHKTSVRKGPKQKPDASNPVGLSVVIPPS